MRVSITIGAIALIRLSRLAAESQRRPAAFGGAGHHELGNIERSALLAERLNGVHGFDNGFCHGKMQRPGLVAGLQVLLPGVDDQRILGLAPIKRLVGDVIENCKWPFDGIGGRHSEDSVLRPAIAAGIQQRTKIRVLRRGPA